MPEKKEIGTLVTAYLQKNPTMPSRSVARLISKEHPHLATIDNLRTRVRYYRGTNGHKNRLKAGFEVDMPPSDNTEWLPYIVPDEYRNTWIMADTHIPYHDLDAIKLFVKMAQEKKVDSVIIDGDMMDFLQVSHFNRNPEKRNIVSEIRQGNWFLDYLEDELPNARIIYKTANHEARLDTFIMNRCPEIWGMDGLNLASQFDIPARGIILVADKRIIKYGHLNIIHMDEFSKGINDPVNPARTLYLKTHTTSAGAHHHRPSTHTESDLDSKQTTCWTIGCLCGLHPEWMPINKWCLGSAFVTKDRSGNFEFNNFKVIKGRIYPA